MVNQLEPVTETVNEVIACDSIHEVYDDFIDTLLGKMYVDDIVYDNMSEIEFVMNTDQKLR